MDAGTPLIPPGERHSDLHASPTPTSLASPSGTLPTPFEYRAHGQSPPDASRVEMQDAMRRGYQSSAILGLDEDVREPAAAAASSSSSSSAAGSRMGRRRSSGQLRIVARLGDADSSLSRAHHPLLTPQDERRDSHSESGDRLHPLLSPVGSESVVLDMMPHLAPGERAVWIAARWALAQPDDVFVHTFSFLTPGELANVSSVNRSWSHAAYEPSLWTHMDLSSLYTRVDDAFITHLLGSNRFIQLQFLSLEGCSAITNKSIKSILYFCPNLREIRLTECAHINNPWVFVELVRALPYLRKLELYGVTKEFGIVTPMLTIRPKLDLGLFWREYAAENGIRMDGKGLANCRYDEGADDPHAPPPPRPAGGVAAGANGQRGCWGRVKGRLVYGNDFYHRGGNYPKEVLYSCENHHEQDFTDTAYHRCHVCEHLFSAEPDRESGVVDESMWTPLICRVCFDQTNLQNKTSWIRLDSASLRAFSFSDVLTRTIHVASRKNLPVSLRSFGATPGRLDYSIPEDEEEEDAGGAGGLDDGEERKLIHRRPPVDLTAVPLSTFVSVNGWRVDETVRVLRGHLTAASDALNTRALLVYDAHEQIEVLADKRVILDGKEGEEHMQLTVQAWHQALEILYPIVIIMVIVLHFSVLFVKQTQPTYDGTYNYAAFIQPPASDALSTMVVLIIAVIGLVLLVVCIFLVYRFREQCERCFKRFLVADILLIFMFGVATLLWLLVAQWRVYMDTLTFIGIIWNLSMIGLLSLYYPMPERLHHFFLILLNAIMGIMMVATLGKWLVLTFLLLFSLGDILSELRPQMRFLSAFIIPQGVELIYNTPKILYTVGGLRLRAADLMCFGMLTGLALSSGNSHADYGSVLLGGAFCFVCVLSSLALMLFVAPFVGVRFRPLPLAVVSAFICTMMEDQVFMPYILRQQNLTVQPVVFSSNCNAATTLREPQS